MRDETKRVIKWKETLMLKNNRIKCDICNGLNQAITPGQTLELCFSCQGARKNRSCRKCGSKLVHEYFYHEYCKPDIEWLDLSCGTKSYIHRWDNV